MYFNRENTEANFQGYCLSAEYKNNRKKLYVSVKLHKRNIKKFYSNIPSLDRWNTISFWNRSCPYDTNSYETSNERKQI